MKEAIICDGNILIVGDGDFSFTVALAKHCGVRPGQIHTSNLETETSILHHAQASENMTYLKDLGVSVSLETDARDLHNHPEIKKEQFDLIIFNFPLADRHHIKKNRSLLADFFSSCKSVLAAKGRVLVTLCKGQGGTPADQPVRSWHDSWQVVAVATNAGFVLREVLPFDPSDFPEYHSVGFRFQDKSFHVTGALTHLFEEGELVDDSYGSVRGVVVENGKSYSTSRYVASCLSRNLLQEPRNPICLLSQNLEQRLKSEHSNIIVNRNVSACMIPSHKSSACLASQEEVGGGESLRNAGMEEVTSTQVDKDWKNCENMRRLQRLKLAHGVADTDTDTCDESNGEMREGDVNTDVALTTFLPKSNENVYIGVKTTDSNAKTLCGEDIDKTETEDGGGGGVSATDNLEACCCGGDASSQVYHCRTSLLENLPYLCQVLTTECGSGSNAMRSQLGDGAGAMDEDNTHHHAAIVDQSDTSATPTISATCVTDCPSHPQGTNPSDSQCNATPSKSSSSHRPESETGSTRKSSDFSPPPPLVASGQCVLPCAIASCTTPTKHELLILHLLRPIPQCLGEDVVFPSSGVNKSHFDAITSKMLSLLQSLHPRCASSISHLPNTNTNGSATQINVAGTDETSMAGQFVSSPTADTDDNKSNPLKCVSVILHSRIGNNHYHITVINLEHLACSMFGFDDPRLVWSVSERFLNQFQADLSLCQFSPFSLYPMKFAHHLSFWENADEDSDQFYDFGLYEVVRNVCGDLVTSARLTEVYVEPSTKRRGRCYRLFFWSGDKCLPYVTSWKLQSQIRIELAKSLGVQLR